MGLCWLNLQAGALLAMPVALAAGIAAATRQDVGGASMAFVLVLCIRSRKPRGWRRRAPGVGTRLRTEADKAASNWPLASRATVNNLSTAGVHSK